MYEFSKSCLAAAIHSSGCFCSYPMVTMTESFIFQIVLPGLLTDTQHAGLHVTPTIEMLDILSKATDQGHHLLGLCG